jgi:hypothetical protein
MNALILGIADKTEQLLQRTTEPFLLIDDGPIADAFADKFPDAKIFNPRRHSFTFSRDYKSVRAFADALYSAGYGANTLTVRNGKRALATLLTDTTVPLHKLDGDRKDPAIAEALGTIDDLLLSPVLKRVLTRKPNFDFSGSVIAKLDRAQLGDFDAYILAILSIGQHQGQIVVPDFGAYGCPIHVSLIRQERLIAGLNTLSEVELPLRQQLLLIPDKHGAQCLYDDALELAKYKGYIPGVGNHTTFVQELTLPPAHGER